MMIVRKCSHCGRQVIVGDYNGRQCVFCQSAVDGTEPNTKESRAVAACEKYLSEQGIKAKASERMACFDAGLQRFPHISVLYWCRLLGKHKCRNERHLLEKGIHFIDDPDFFAAYDCGSSEEKEYYLSLVRVYEALQIRLLETIDRKKREDTLATGLLQKQKDTYDELQRLSKEFSQKMQAFSRMEMQIKDKVTDLEVYLASLRAAADSAYTGISGLQSEVLSKPAISDQKKNEYIGLMGRYFGTSELALQLAKGYTGTKLYAGYQELLNRREQAKKDILSLIDRIKALNTDMKKLIADIEKIHKKFENAAEQTKTENYELIAVILGNTEIRTQLTDVLKSQSK